MRLPRYGLPLLAALLAGGCARAPSVMDLPVPEAIKPYRITIQQGNYVTREMVDQLKPGMTREQVRFILGTPLLTDIFHADRWDYVFYRDAPGGKREQRTFSVIFAEGKLSRVVGDLLPSEPVQPAAKPAPKPAPKPEAKPVAKPEAPKPAPAAEPKQATGQNWGIAPQAEATPAPKPEPKAEEKPADKPAAAKPERGFFGRMLEKIGL